MSKQWKTVQLPQWQFALWDKDYCIIKSQMEAFETVLTHG